MKTKKYIVIRNVGKSNINAKEYKKIKGFKVNPRNSFSYPLSVDSMIIIKPVFIEKILKKKIKKKLDYYLQYIISLIDEEEDAEGISEKLDEVSRYKNTVDFKYRKFLNDKYIELLIKKITLLEHEMKSKMIYVKPKKETQYNINIEEEEMEKGKSR